MVATLVFQFALTCIIYEYDKVSRILFAHVKVKRQLSGNE